MRAFTVAERRNRLARRHFLSADGDGRSAAAVTAALIGLHASDPATPYLSLWARSPGFVIDDLDRELYRTRSVVKHLAMRRTLWVIGADAVPAIQAAASDRVAAGEQRRLVADVAKTGIADDSAAWLERARAAVLRHLTRHGPATGTELRAALPELAGTYDPAPGKRWGGDTPLAPRVLTVLSARGEIMRGPNDGGWTASRPRWETAANWLGASAPVEAPAAARAELTRRWLRAFGPAGLDDIAWWFGSTRTAVRAALAEVGAVQVDLHGMAGYALPDDLDPEPDVAPWGALLPGLDITTMGWHHRDWYLGEHRGQTFDRYGNAGPTAWWCGRVVGGWRQDDDGRVLLQLLEDPGRDARRALAQRAEDLTDWLGGLRISPRFPSPLVKAARR